MKKVILVLILLLATPLFAQNETEIPDIFVRVYDLNGHKLGKGKIISFSGATLQLKRGNRTKEFPVSDIGSIKTKRSGGNNLLIGATVGAVTGGIVGAASADPDAWIFGYTAAEGAFGGAVLGGGAGFIVGGISTLFKNSKTFPVNGDPVKLKVFIDSINKP